MDQAEFDFAEEISHPVDLAEALAAEMGWTCSRDDDEQLLIEFEGMWRLYRIAVSLLEGPEILTVRAGFEMKLENSAQEQILKIVNHANQVCPVGSFTVHHKEEAIVFGCGHSLAGGAQLSFQQVRSLLEICISQCERFYPAFQMVAYGGKDAASAVNAAILEPMGEC